MSLLFVVRRTAVGLVTLFLVSVLVFGATQALPGDAARSILGRNATPERLEAARQELNLDKSKIEQYGHWLSGVVRGDFGRSLTSLQQDEKVTSILGPRIMNSIILVGLALLITVPASIMLGALSAYRRDGPFDHATSLVSLVLAALPDFAIAIGLVFALSTSVLHVFPAVSALDPHISALGQLDMLVLPVLTLVIWETPYIARILRASMIEVLETEYVEAARLKGLSEWRVLTRHALPNALVPLIQVLAVQTAFLAGSVVVVEFVFGYPGIGQELVVSVTSRDVPTVQAAALVIAAVYVGVNFLSDVATILVSPRLRTGLR